MNVVNMAVDTVLALSWDRAARELTPGETQTLWAAQRLLLGDRGGETQVAAQLVPVYHRCVDAEEGPSCA